MWFLSSSTWEYILLAPSDCDISASYALADSSTSGWQTNRTNLQRVVTRKKIELMHFFQAISGKHHINSTFQLSLYWTMNFHSSISLPQALLMYFHVQSVLQQPSNGRWMARRNQMQASQSHHSTWQTIRTCTNAPLFQNFTGKQNSKSNIDQGSSPWMLGGELEHSVVYRSIRIHHKSQKLKHLLYRSTRRLHFPPFQSINPCCDATSNKKRW